MTNQLTIRDELTEFLLYSTPDGKVKVEIFFHNDNIWLTQKRMAELFGVDVSTIKEHLKNIYKTDELQELATVGKFPIVRKEGTREVRRELNFYNLDAIISVGYRVNSSQATRFRIWATERLKEFMLKGFILDDDRLKNGRYFGKDYFQELLERVRSIRASERRIYQQITDIFAECSLDYDPKSDAKIAKNYLQEKEIKKLERTITGFFDYIENIIENRSTFTMEEFASSVDKFLTFNEYQILPDHGSVSKDQAMTKAGAEYEKFNKIQKIESDFDRELKKLALLRKTY